MRLPLYNLYISEIDRQFAILIKSSRFSYYWSGSALNLIVYTFRCFVRKPYGFLSFYGPVVIGVTINWILFPFIARVIIASGKLESEQTNMSDMKVKTVSNFTESQFFNLSISISQSKIQIWFQEMRFRSWWSWIIKLNWNLSLDTSKAVGIMEHFE